MIKMGSIIITNIKKYKLRSLISAYYNKLSGLNNYQLVINSLIKVVVTSYCAIGYISIKNIG